MLLVKLFGVICRKASGLKLIPPIESVASTFLLAKLTPNTRPPEAVAEVIRNLLLERLVRLMKTS